MFIFFVGGVKNSESGENMEKSMKNQWKSTIFNGNQVKINENHDKIIVYWKIYNTIFETRWDV